MERSFHMVRASKFVQCVSETSGRYRLEKCNVKITVVCFLLNNFLINISFDFILQLSCLSCRCYIFLLYFVPVLPVFFVWSTMRLSVIFANKVLSIYLYFKIFDPSARRYEVPIETPPVPKRKPADVDYRVEFVKAPFGITVFRQSTGAVLYVDW